jgi:hypothetical protein
MRLAVDLPKVIQESISFMEIIEHALQLCELMGGKAFLLNCLTNLISALRSLPYSR